MVAGRGELAAGPTIRKLKDVVALSLIPDQGHSACTSGEHIRVQGPRLDPCTAYPVRSLCMACPAEVVSAV